MWHVRLKEKDQRDKHEVWKSWEYITIHSGHTVALKERISSYDHCKERDSTEKKAAFRSYSIASQSTKLLRSALSQRRRALNHCGDPYRFQTIGLTLVGSGHRMLQTGIGRYACTALAPSHVKLSICVHLIKAINMIHDSIWNSSIDTVPNHITKNKTDEFSSQSILRRSITANRRLHQRYPERSFALFVNVGPFALVCKHFAKSYTPRSDLMTVRVRTR